MSLNEDFEREREEAYADGYADGLRAGKLAFHTEYIEAKNRTKED